AEDLETGTPPSGRTTEDDILVTLSAGNVLTSAMGVARVVATGDHPDPDGRQWLTESTVLGPYLTLYQVDQERPDPDFLAGALRAVDPRDQPGSSRMDFRRVRIPRLPLAEQRAYGRAFRELGRLADVVRETAIL